MIEGAFDPTTNEITNTRITQEQAVSEDRSVRHEAGVSIHDAPVISGETLFNYAGSGGQGAARIAQMHQQFEDRGHEEILKDVFASSGASFLSRIAGIEKSTTETGSTDMRGELYGDASIGTPAPAGWFGLSVRGGARASAGSTDTDQTSRAESVSDYNVKIRNAFDETLGRGEGDRLDRAADFADRLQEMRINAEDLGQAVAEKASDPDGFFGALPDLANRTTRDGEPQTIDDKLEQWSEKPPNFGGR